MVADEEASEEKEGDLSVAAALSKIVVGVALLVREVGVALLRFFGGGGICVSALFALCVLWRFSKSDASPRQINAACLDHDSCWQCCLHFLLREKYSFFSFWTTCAWWKVFNYDHLFHSIRSLGEKGADTL